MQQWSQEIQGALINLISSRPSPGLLPVGDEHAKALPRAMSGDSLPQQAGALPGRGDLQQGRAKGAAAGRAWSAQGFYPLIVMRSRSCIPGQP